MTWTPPNPCDSYEADLSETIYVPAPCTPYEWGAETEIVVIINASGTLSLVLQDHIVGGGQDENLPTTLGPAQIKFPWGTASKVERHLKFVWDRADVTDRPTDSIVWGSADRLEVEKTIPWGEAARIDKPTIHIPWGDFEIKIDNDYEQPWTQTLPFKDLHKNIPWGEVANHLSNDISSPFISNTPIKDVHYNIPWNALAALSRDIQIPHELGNPVDKHFNFYYGRYAYSSLFFQKYFAPPPCYQLQWQDNALPGLNPCDGSTQINMTFTGNSWVNPFDHWNAGIRDQYLIVPPGTPGLIYRKFFYMRNIVTLKRIPDNTPIDAFAISIGTDINSWTWTFNITLAEESYLDLLKPSVAGEDLVLQDCQITINNNVFICRVESWHESRTFGKKTWTVSGRSPSIELGSPYSLPFTYTNTSIKQGSELIDDLLSGTGWSAEWGFDNNTSTYSDVLNPATGWSVPIKQFNLQEKTTMEGIKQVLNAIKAGILTVPDCDSTNQRLIILPRYRWTPWQWDSKTTDEDLIASYCHEIGSDYDHIPKYNFVVAAGDTQGVAVSATKTGTAGDKIAPMFTHPLITTQDAGHEAARNILSNQGMWLNRSMKLLSIDDGVTPTGEVPGLLLPGKLISFTEGSTWKGVITSTNISVQAATDRSGLEVYQTVVIEQYLG